MSIIYKITASILLVTSIIFLIVIFANGKSNVIDNMPMEIKSKIYSPPDILILKIAHQYSEYSPQHRALLEKFIPIIQENSNGKIIVEVYPYGQLGNDAVCIQGLGYGTIEMAMVDLSIIIGQDPGEPVDLEKSSYSLKFDDVDDIINQKVRPMGSICLNISSNGFKQIFVADARKEYSHQIYRYISPEKEDFIEAAVKKEEYLADIVRKHEFRENVTYENMFIYESTLVDSVNSPYYKRLEKIFMTHHQEEIQMFLISERFWELLLISEIEIVTEATKQTALHLNQLVESYERNILNEYKKNKVLVCD